MRRARNDPDVREHRAQGKTEKALKNISLDTDAAKHISDKDALLEALKHDKKSASGGKINAVLLRDIGNFEFTSLTPEEIIERLD